MNDKVITTAATIATAFVCTGMAMVIFLPEYKIVRSLNELLALPLTVP